MQTSEENLKKLLERALNDAAESHGQDVIRKKYERVVLIALGRFQLLEFGLKRYIEKRAHLTENPVAKKVLLKDLEDLSLGVLLKRLTKIDPCEPLIEQIKPLLKFRNEIAHQALLWTTGVDTIDLAQHFNTTIVYSYNAMTIEDCLREVLGRLKAL